NSRCCRARAASKAWGCAPLARSSRSNRSPASRASRAVPPRRMHRTRRTLTPLDATYRARALPPGSAQYWSWLFAAAPLRAPLLGIFALGAEWRALMAPGIEPGVAHLKLAWWRDEIQRLAAGSPVHPIGRYLAELPGPARVDFSPLHAAIDAAAAQVGGVPLEHSAELMPHCRALWGDPLLLASQLAAAADA